MPNPSKYSRVIWVLLTRNGQTDPNAPCKTRVPLVTLEKGALGETGVTVQGMTSAIGVSHSQ
jgi:hypothetical protein